MDYVIWGVAGFFFGTVVAYLSYRFTMPLIQTATKSGNLMLVSFARQLINAIALLVVFLVRNWLPGPFPAVLLGSALGLTLPVQLKAFFLARQTSSAKAAAQAASAATQEKGK